MQCFSTYIPEFQTVNLSLCLLYSPLSCLPVDMENETGIEVKIKHDKRVHSGFCSDKCPVSTAQIKTLGFFFIGVLGLSGDCTWWFCFFSRELALG